MKKLKLYITASLDGYIASPDGDLDWLIEHPVPSKEDHEKFLNSVDTVIISGNTFNIMFYMDILWPYKDYTTYVVTHNPSMEKENVNYITSDVIETIAQLKQEEGKDIWLVSGGKLTSLLHEYDLIDEIIVTHIPVDLNVGTLLFSDKIKESDWILKEQISYENDAIKKVYQRAQ
jgi:Dihydrofolate reductase